MIPKIIHYCWFGKNKKPQKIEFFISGFEKLKQHGYRIIEWNEENYDVESIPFVKEAYKKKKWAHVSDYVRLDVLNKYGGIYLDTDVEIIKSFDDILDFNFFLGFMWKCNLGTAVIGASQNNSLIKEILNIYNKKEISLSSPNNDLLTNFFIDNVQGFKLNGRDQKLPGKVLILSDTAFEQPSFRRRKNYTVHHFSQTWKNTPTLKSIVKTNVIKVIGLYAYRKYVCYKSLRISPFYSQYLKDKHKG